MVFTYAREVAGGRRGPRKRELRVPAAENPTAREFEAYLAQEGPDGGCCAVIEREPKRRRGMVVVGDDGNFTPMDTELYRAEMTEEAWRLHEDKWRA